MKRYTGRMRGSIAKHMPDKPGKKALELSFQFQKPMEVKPMRKWVLFVSGGTGSNTWDNEIEIDADTFMDAVKQVKEKLAETGDGDANIDGLVAAELAD